MARTRTATNPVSAVRSNTEMTPAQCRAARGLLDWTQGKLVEAAGLLLSTVVKFERNGRDVRAETVQTMKRALESASIEVLCREWQRRRREVSGKGN
jgi:hypothetical protein